MKCDVAILGGGPAGSTVGTLLKKYRPQLDVAIFEREQFPREHVGESLLPAISYVLDEMGVWGKVEAANFPIKVGGTYRWGASNDLWDLDFLQGHLFENGARPENFQGQRRQTSFQVDRSVYDSILLDHAQSSGCQVFQRTKVTKVNVDGDTVSNLEIRGDTVEARYYVDCSGDSGILRRTLEISCEYPTKLRNIGIWDYWQDAEWAVTLGCGGTRIQVMSLGWGWLWFIPIGPTRTSIGLVVPVDYFKTSGKSTEQIYSEAVSAEPLISQLVTNAKRENKLQTTRDWSFIADRLYGSNWFLAGDSAGFADPILSAGVTLAHAGARKLAYSILELERGELDAEWIKKVYERETRRQIGQHIQFADFWYSSNGCFTDLKEYCTEIAESVGHRMNADEAFRWLASGGFALEEPGAARALGFPIAGLKFLTAQIGGDHSTWEVAKSNVWMLLANEKSAERFPRYWEGRINPVDCLSKGDRLLPVLGAFRHVLNALNKMDAALVLEECVPRIMAQENVTRNVALAYALQAVEALIAEGWVKAKANPSRPFVSMS